MVSHPGTDQKGKTQGRSALTLRYQDRTQIATALLPHSYALQSEA